jgi:nucleoside-diphosphate-sugar epimerase
MTVNQSDRLTVAVTGAAGYIAGRLIGALDADERVGRILGFDIVEDPEIEASKLIYDRLDIRDPALESRLKGVDVVVHLAFIMDPIKDESAMRDVNVNGSQNVFRCAGRAGVPKLIYTSSATVYGAHPDNDVPLTEESPLRANFDFSYPAHKLEVEYVVREVRDEFPEMMFTIFRPVIVFGYHADHAWSHLLETPVTFAVRGYKPPLQFVHEEDVARALRFAVFHDLDGAYNLAPEGWLEWDEIIATVGRRTADLPEAAAFSLQERLWDMGLAEAPAGMLHYAMHPWVVATGKLSAAGFKCERSNLEALEATVERTSRLIRLGSARVEKGKLRAGALVGAGVIGGLALLGGLRRRGRRHSLIG